MIDAAGINIVEITARLVLQLFLLAGSAFFSSSETALFSLSQLDLQKLRRDRHPRTNTLYKLLEQPRRLIISILCGNELINVAAAANMAAILVMLFGADDAKWINVLIMVPLLLLVSEVTPKTIAVANPVRYSSSVVAAPMMIWIRIVTPLRHLVRIIADRVATLIVGTEKAPENLLRIDEFQTLVSDAEEQGDITPTERTLVYNLLAAGSTEIVEIMTPRTRTCFINADLPAADVLEQVCRYRHHRLPVYRRNRDNALGFLFAEDLFGDGIQKLERDGIESLLHPLIVAPPTKKVDEMFDFFQAKGSQAAVVMNEFGGVDGLVTLKDVLRFIFGHMAGPVAGQHLYEERDQDHYVVPGEMRLSEFNRLTRFGVEDPRMTTIGGVLYRHLDRLPVLGDAVVFDGITLSVAAMDGHRITRVEAQRGGPVEPSGEQG